MEEERKIAPDKTQGDKKARNTLIALINGETPKTELIINYPEED